MNLYQIVLPLFTNDRKTDYKAAHAEFRKHVLNTLGGLSECRPMRGAWRDNGKTYYDDVTPYQIAAEPAQWAEVVAKAFELFPDQLAIMHCQLGTATIETRKDKAA